MRRFLLCVVALAAPALTAYAGQAAGDKAEESPWPAPVPGWKAPEPGEHPRLFFRRWELPEIRRRAETPEGKRIVERLRFLLNGSDGETLPSVYNPSRKSTNSSVTPADTGDAFRGPSATAGLDAEDEGEVEALSSVGTQASGVGHTNINGLASGTSYTLWHAAGYGVLWQITGMKKYADLGRECVEKALAGQRDRDNRYSFVSPNGALRSGPSLGAIAMGYDLCYDGWDEDFRRKAAQAIANYNQGPYLNIDDLARGARHFPGKNHWGGQVGGAALALLAVWKDPAVDSARIERLMATNAVCMILHLTEGFCEGGLYSESHGPGGIASDTAFVPALQAWKIAGGKDFIAPRPNASYITVLKAHELVLIDGRPWYPLRFPSSYGSGNFSPFPVGGMQSDRSGLSRAGQFAQGFGVVQEKYKPALLWVYNEIVEKDAAARTFDTVSPYPHRAALALVNWPIGMEPVNPERIIPKTHEDPRRGYLVTRNQWKDDTDIVVTMKIPAGEQLQPIMVWGLGMRFQFANSPGPTRPYFRKTNDGSVIVSNPKGLTYVAADFSKASGAELLLATIGKYAKAAKGVKAASGASATFHSISVGGYTNLVLLTVQSGAPPAPRVEGDAIVVGKQTVRFDGRRFVLGVMAEGPPEQTFPWDFVYSPEYERKLAGDRALAATEQAERRKQQIADTENRFKEAEKLIEAGKLDDARALAEALMKASPPLSPNLERATKLLRKIDGALLEGN